jgi:hypothetical protein
MDRKLKDVTDKEYAALERVAKTGRLPKDADFELVTGFIPGDGNTYEKWSVRLRMPREKAGANYGFSIREQFLSVHPTDPEETDSPRPKVSLVNAVRQVASPVNVDPPSAELARDEDQNAARHAKLHAEREAFAKQLVGTWRGGVFDGDVVFRPDGTFEESPRTLTDGSKEGRKHFPGADSVQGRWGCDNIQYSPGLLWLRIESTGSILRGLPKLPFSSGELNQQNYRVLLLDDSYLRVCPSEKDTTSDTLFFRKVQPEAAKPKAVTTSRRDVQLLATIADLNATEAAAIADANGDWAKAWGIELDDLEGLARLAAAKRGEIEFAELFQLSAEEMTAYSSLYSLTGGDFNQLADLWVRQQLSGVESAAVKKIKHYRESVGKTMSIFETSVPTVKAKPAMEAHLKSAQDKLSNAPLLKFFLESCLYPKISR